MSKKRLLLFSVLILASLILMTYQSRKGALKPLNFLLYPINSINNSIHSVSSSVKDHFRKIRLRDEENKKLKHEIDKLLMEQQKYKDAELENSRLRELLSLKEKEERYVAAARVISRGNDRWSNVIVIDKGKADGIEKDMAVITPKGLIGKILSAANSYSSVMLINDTNFSAAVRLNDSRTEAVISGKGSKICILKYVAHENEAKMNEIVLTSGLDGLFPADIPIGSVTKIIKKNTGFFQNIEVTPFQDTSKIEEVVIVGR